jgi:hypothetical protein
MTGTVRSGCSGWICIGAGSFIPIGGHIIQDALTLRGMVGQATR